MARLVSFKQNAIFRSKVVIQSLLRIMLIRKYINQSTCEILICSLVLSKLDYANGILSGASDTVINVLQRVQNWAAKVILKRRKYDSSTQARLDLHWLLMRERIEFKILLLVHKCLKDEASDYLKDLLIFSKRRPGLRNNKDAQKLIVPYVSILNKTFASRSFSVFGPKCWNNLPINIRVIQNTEHFKRELKTHLFWRAYNIDSDKYTGYTEHFKKELKTHLFWRAYNIDSDFVFYM